MPPDPSLVLDLVLKATPVHGLDPIASDPSVCPNCGQATANLRSPYCSVPCREQAAIVRQLRVHLRSGVPADRLEGLAQALWHVLGGGYPARVALVPARVREKVLLRHQGRCELCDQPATEIDHARTACNRPINLRPVCEGCRVWRPYLDPQVLIASQPVLLDLVERTHSPLPIRLCDSADDWNWRDLLRERKALASESQPL